MQIAEMLPGLRLVPAWLSPTEADAALAALRADVAWRQESITLFGKQIPQPRLTAWYGDEDARYSYSGIALVPLPWTPLLASLRARASEAAATPFNSVLLNLYRNGHDSMGLHADDEPELGPDPTIASISLGAVRRFTLRPRRPKAGRAGASLELPHGSLLVMEGGVQARWLHGVPKQPSVAEPRINLTFRRIAPSSR